MAEQQEGRWVTLDNGVHLFIKKGQTLDDAIEQNISKEKRQEQDDYDNLSAREYGQKYAKTEEPKENKNTNDDKVSFEISDDEIKGSDTLNSLATRYMKKKYPNVKVSMDNYFRNVYEVDGKKYIISKDATFHNLKLEQIK